MKFKLNPDLLPKLKYKEKYAIVRKVKLSAIFHGHDHNSAAYPGSLPYEIIEQFECPRELAEEFNNLCNEQSINLDVFIVSKLGLNGIVSLED